MLLEPLYDQRTISKTGLHRLWWTWSHCRSHWGQYLSCSIVHPLYWGWFATDLGEEYWLEQISSILELISVVAVRGMTLTLSWQCCLSVELIEPLPSLAVADDVHHFCNDQSVTLLPSFSVCGILFHLAYDLYPSMHTRAKGTITIQHQNLKMMLWFFIVVPKKVRRHHTHFKYMDR